MTENRREIGSRYETLAADYLTSLGMTVLERNFRCRQGEIDLIVMDGQTLAFVEVKYRKDGSYGGPEAAVDRRKQQHMRLAAGQFLRQHPQFACIPCRFDVVAFQGNRFRYIRQAFGGI